jgi:hypothetical protein
MPYKIEADPAHPGKKRVVNSETGDVKGSGQTDAEAHGQFGLLEGIEHGNIPPGGSNDRTRTRRNPGGSR